VSQQQGGGAVEALQCPARGSPDARASSPAVRRADVEGCDACKPRKAEPRLACKKVE
jgi:hypothetical protein